MKSKLLLALGSELDDATQQTLIRGVRLIEILNQRPYAPLPLYYQIVLIYAATRGFFDRLEVAKVTKFKELLAKALANSALYDMIVEMNSKISLPAIYAVYDSLINKLLGQL